MLEQGIALLEHHDSHAPLRNMLRDVAEERDEWSGIPMPLDGEQLVIEPTYPNAEKLMAMCGRAIGEPDFVGPPKPPLKIRNTFSCPARTT